MEQEPKHLSIAADETTAARITAWVLGQASAFEAEQLEELCRLEPEWHQFAQHMRQLHGIMEDTVNDSADDSSWKISAEKRQTLLDKLGTPPPAAKAKWRISRATLARVACVTVFFGLSGAFFVNSFVKGGAPIMAKMSTRSYSLESSAKPEMAVMEQEKKIVKELRDKRTRYLSSAPTITPAAEKAVTQQVAQQDDVMTLSKKAQSEGMESLAANDIVVSGGAVMADGFGSGGQGGGGQGLMNYGDSRDKSASLDVVREFHYNTEYEPPELPNSVSSSKSLSGIAVAPAKPATALEDRLDSVATNGAFYGEEARPQARTSRTDGEALSDQKSFGRASVRFGDMPSEPSAAAPAVVAGTLSFNTAVNNPQGLAEHVDGYDVDDPTSQSESKNTAWLRSSEGMVSKGLKPAASDAFHDQQSDQSLMLLTDGAASNAVGALGWAGNAQVENNLEKMDIASVTTATGAQASQTNFSKPEDATKLAEGDRVPTLGEIPGLGTLFNRPKQSDELTKQESPSARASDIPLDTKANGKWGSIAERETIRRQNSISEADELHRNGREAYEKQDFAKAAELLGKARELLPNAPALQDRVSAIDEDIAVTNTVLAGQLRRVGKYEEGRKLLEDAIVKAPSNKFVQKESEYFDDPIRTNPALTYEHTESVDQVRRKLYLGEGNYNLGKYDEAKKEFESILRIDPYNKAARRWLERTAAIKSDYYRSAYDHTRAEMLEEVDKAWELAVPSEGKDGDPGGVNKNNGNIQDDGGDKVVRREIDVDLSNHVFGYVKNAAPQDAKNTELEKKSKVASGKSDNPASRFNFYLDYPLDDVPNASKENVVSSGLRSGNHAIQSKSATLTNDTAREAIRKKRENTTKELKDSEAQLNDSKNRLKQVTEKISEIQSGFGELADIGSIAGLKQSLVDTAKKIEEATNQYNEGISKVTDAQIKAKMTATFAAEKAQLVDVEEQLQRAVNNAGQLFEAQKESDELMMSVAEMERAIEREKMVLHDLQKHEEDLLATEDMSQIEAPILDTPETTTTQEPYSTFSLRVSDASFQLAYNSLQQDKRPQAQDIRVEDFYNAFDYGDPTPAAGEPVVCFMEQAAHPLYAQKNWLRLGMRVASTGRSAAQPLHLTLLVDQSGSMEREDRHEIMNAAIRELGHLLTANDRISVIGFSRTSRLLGENISGAEMEKWQSMVTAAPNDGGTNLEEALALGEIIAARQQLPTAQNRILLLTDGAANLGNADPVKLATRVKSLRQRGLNFDVVGIGTGGENDRRLLELARHGNGRYQVLQNANDAKERFAKQLAGAFRPAAENVKVQVRFNEARVASYKLNGFEKDLLKTEDFRNDRVDAAEMSADEAGNAVYQITPMAEGQGDIGEVSVRFRDPDTGLMVERKWTIPYESNTPAFDRSSPSMQLAGLSLLVAEKLKGSPLGAMARPDDLSKPSETVRQQFSTQPNAVKLLEMVRKVQP